MTETTDESRFLSYQSSSRPPATMQTDFNPLKSTFSTRAPGGGGGGGGGGRGRRGAGRPPGAG
ncbi:MAG: hypothetical protein LBK99_14345, partial [Opitutaceae bacterium]|nr:hypothetical protein [Opitutaceae bacterium]